MTSELPPADLPAWRHTTAHRRAVQAALKNRPQTAIVLRELKAERARQDASWGQQDHPDYHGQVSLDWFEAEADSQRNRANHHAANGTLSWDHILLEEVAEARLEMAAGRQDRLRAELIQVMAVAAAWVEALDRRELAAIPDKVLSSSGYGPWTTPRPDGAPHLPECRFTWPEHPGPCDVDPAEWTFHGPDDVCSEGSQHRTRCVQIPGLHPPVFGRTTVSGMARAKMGVPEAGVGDVPRITTYGADADTVEALRNAGYQVEAWPAVAGAVTGRFTPAEAPTEEAPRGAAGQPVTSYSGGGVRDVTEGKPRLDLMWPLGVPFEAQMLTRVGLWLELGMRKYAERNWEKFHTQEALNHALASKARHDAHYACGDTDEDHAAAIITNVIFAETIRWKIANGWMPDQEPKHIPPNRPERT